MECNADKIYKFIVSLLPHTLNSFYLANRMIDAHDEENQKSDVEAVLLHSQCKFKSSFFLKIGVNRSHISVSLESKPSITN